MVSSSELKTDEDKFSDTIFLSTSLLSFFSDTKSNGTDVDRCSHNKSEKDELSKLPKKIFVIILNWQI